MKYTLSYWEPYITGAKAPSNSVEHVQVDEEVLRQFVDALASYKTGEMIFTSCFSHTDFFDTAVDFKHLVPKEQRAEVFYTAKLKQYSPQVPAMCLYVLQQIWATCHGIPNLVTKQLSAPYYMQFCAPGYLKDLTLGDVIRNVCTEEYTPLSETNLKNKLKEFTEIYVVETDMVAALPHEIGDVLSSNDIPEITLTPNGLSCKGQLLRTMSGKFGITNSTYDLRNVI